jgi:hypothetical protein
MLSPEEARRGGRRRYSLSPRQEYDEYVMQRVESYKNALSRGELMALAERATLALGQGPEEQFVLTEVLVQQWVDELIKKELGLTSYRKWSRKVAALREAQRQPTHWGLGPEGPLARLVPRLEPGDVAVLAGPSTEAAAGLLCAHHARVTFLAGDCWSAGRVEDRLEGEALADRAQAFVIAFNGWLPEEVHGPIHVAVFDTALLGAVGSATAHALIDEFRTRTAPGGVHVLLDDPGGLAPDALRSLYDGWEEVATAGNRRGDLQFVRPSCQSDTAVPAGERVV